MPKFSYSKKQLLQLISKDEIERIHVASMKILEDNGVMIKNDRAYVLVAIFSSKSALIFNTAF